METISVAINDSSDVLCFVLYLINIFEKSTKAQRCTDVNGQAVHILGTHYFVLLDSTFGAR